MTRFVGLLVLLPFGLLAQPAQLASTGRKADTGRASTVPMVSTVASPATAADPMVLPLFGERSKTAEQIGWEVRFLNDCDQNFNNRQEASQFFASRAWEYLAEGQLDTATHRFNLAWLLNERSSEPYWGLGVVSYQRNLLPEAIRLMKKGLDVADSNAVLMTDLASVQIKHFQEQQDSTMLDEAATWLQKSVTLEPNYATTHLRLSWVHYYRGDYPRAWEYLHNVRKLDLAAMDVTYLNLLMTRLPDPQGFFKGN